MSPVPQFAPPQDDPRVRPFWEATSAGRLTLPACGVCGDWQWYPLGGLSCHQEAALVWKDVPGEGVIYTFTRVERAFLPFGGDPPYTLALIELDGVAGPRLVTVLVGQGSDAPSIGDRVRLAPTVFETHTLPTFELAAA
jgi:uncharacterized OB-fold protein